MSDLELWYDAPATLWTEALPVGNGRLGAMVFGGTAREHLQLNEDTLFTGGPYSQVNPEALPHLAEVRDLLFAGRYAEAEALADRHLMGRPLRQMSFQPAGDLWLDLDLRAGPANYRRSLDLDSAVATTSFTAGAIGHTREVFATAADGVLVVRHAVDRPGALSLGITLTSEQPGALVSARPDALRFVGTNRDAEGIAGRLRLAIEARLITDGEVSHAGAGLAVSGATEALLLIDAATSFRRFDDVDGDPVASITTRLDAAAARGFDILRQRHLAEHRRLFRRLAVTLGPSPGAALPTDRRIAANVETPDPGLAALYLQFGRYLLLASSRPGTQPATLQGIWNDHIDPPWGSKYTANINLEMNYWLPDPANLGECMEPLLRLAEDLAETGAEMAAAHYGARGWVLHHNTDLWRAAGPVDGAKWGLWPTGGAWLCAQLWDHFRFSGDPAFLARAYPVMAGAARFILDILVPLPGTDLLVTAPSLSPENVHPHGAALCFGPAMDSQIIRELFDAVTAAATALGRDAGFRAEIAAARARLPADRIGAGGQLQEWLEDWDMDAPEPDHRHVSHLYALYPGQGISPAGTPALAAAARRSLELRGDEATGWGLGWRINLWARLEDGARAHRIVQRLLAPDRTYPNLFDAHPPFQIDGNFGGAAGMLEMLVQSRPGELDLLPALPPAWPEGALRGVRARGGLTVDLAWRDGRLAEAWIAGDRPQVIALRHGGRVVNIAVGPTPACFTPR